MCRAVSQTVGGTSPSSDATLNPGRPGLISGSDGFVGLVRQKAGVIAGVALSAAASWLSVEPVLAGASARGFVCGVANGAPATNALKADGTQIPVIRWTSSTFTAAGWGPQRRCEEVSERFDTYLKQGRLAYITTGRMNRLPVICTAASKRGPCDGLLYTLKPGQNATATLKDLLQIRVKARGPLNETSGRLYVSLDELMSTAQANADGGSPSVQPASTSQPSHPLW